MTPKEKAKELYWNFYQNISDTSYPEETAKQCASTAVDEILKITWVDKYLTVEDYWQEVKQELKKL